MLEYSSDYSSLRESIGILQHLSLSTLDFMGDTVMCNYKLKEKNLLTRILIVRGKRSNWQR